MSKFACQCGRIISDNTDYQSNKARLIKDQLSDDYLCLADVLADYLRAAAAGNGAHWAARHLPEVQERQEVEPEMVVALLMSRYLYGPSLLVQQCRECDRLHVLDGEGRRHSFRPEDGESGGLLGAAG